MRCEFHGVGVSVARELSPHPFDGRLPARDAEARGGVSRAARDVEVIDVLDIIRGHVYAEACERFAVDVIPQPRGSKQGAVQVEDEAVE